MIFLDYDHFSTPLPFHRNVLATPGSSFSTRPRNHGGCKIIKFADTADNERYPVMNLFSVAARSRNSRCYVCILETGLT